MTEVPATDLDVRTAGLNETMIPTGLGKKKIVIST